MTMQEWQERIDTVRVAVESGAIEKASRATLMQYNGWLSHANAPMHFARNYDQVCETVRLHLLRSMMESFEARSRKMEFWVMALAVAALISSVVQIFSPVLFRERHTASAPLAPAAQSVAPTHTEPQTYRPAHQRRQGQILQ